MAALFGALAIVAALVPIPGGDGPLLDIVPKPPQSLQSQPEEVVIELEEVERVPLPTEVERATEHTVGAQPDAAPEPDPTDVALREAIAGIVADAAPEHPLSVPCIDGHDADGSGEPGACNRRALDNYFARLRDVAVGAIDTPVRFSQFGDSLIMGDGFPGELRRLLQAQFGDAGHGFVYMANPERPFGAEDLRVGLSEEWTVRTVVHHGSADPLFGFAGAQFRPDGDARIRVRTVDGEFGNSFDRIGVLYFRRDDDGELRLRDNGTTALHSLAGPVGESALTWIDLEPGEHNVLLNAFPPANRYYGLVVEQSGPGAIVDNIGLVSGRMERLRTIDEEHWASQIRLRDTHLLSFSYGVNVAADTDHFQHRQQRYEDEYAEVLERIRRSTPERDCLVISILARGEWVEGEIQPLGSVPLIAAAQEAASRRGGCAFYNAYEAIGGDEGPSRWYRARPQLLGGDLAHPTTTGYQELARMFYRSLMAAFLDYLDARIQAQRESRPVPGASATDEVSP